jgi:hypothetical protein
MKNCTYLNFPFIKNPPPPQQRIFFFFFFFFFFFGVFPKIETSAMKMITSLFIGMCVLEAKKNGAGGGSQCS